MRLKQGIEDRDLVALSNWALQHGYACRVQLYSEGAAMVVTEAVVGSADPYLESHTLYQPNGHVVASCEKICMPGLIMKAYQMATAMEITLIQVHLAGGQPLQTHFASWEIAPTMEEVEALLNQGKELNVSTISITLVPPH